MSTHNQPTEISRRRNPSIVKVLAMRNFSKSKLMALRQCPKRLWLELHRPDLLENSDATQRSFQVGHQVGDIARLLYDSEGTGNLIDVGTEGFNPALTRTLDLLEGSNPIFEAGFAAGGALSFADVMLPVVVNGQKKWRMVEVKSTTEVKGNHLDDVAVQAFVARSAGVPLHSISLAHIDTSWIYQGNGNYQGLLTETDLSEEAFSRSEEVKGWISQAQQIASTEAEPSMAVGNQCSTPYECGFTEHCWANEPVAEHPIHWLPYASKQKIDLLVGMGISELCDVPDELLTERQQRVKSNTVNNSVYFDADGSASELAECGWPAYFMDFESTQFAVPIWKGCRPYQQDVFQFSVHKLDETGQLHHVEFIDLSGNDPSRPFSEALISASGDVGPVYVYNAGYENGRIRHLAEVHPDLRDALLAITERVVDLMPIAKNYYYHPSQQGSWSIKKVLPAMVPELSYEDLDGVADGGMAMEAYQEAISPDCSEKRKSEIRQELLAYCKLDTYAMVRLWQVFAGRSDLKL